MSSSLRRGVAAAALITLPIASLAACGAGNDAGTGQIQPDNAHAQVDDIAVQNVTVVIPEGDDSLASVSGRIFNEGARDQRLEAILLPGSGRSVELTPAEGERALVVPAGGWLALGGEGHAAAVIEDPLGGDIARGNAQRVVFDLNRTGRVGVHARVVGDGEGFDEYAEVAPTPTATQTPTATETPGAEDTEGAGETEGTGEETAGTEETLPEETLPEETTAPGEE